MASASGKRLGWANEQDPKATPREPLFQPSFNGQPNAYSRALGREVLLLGGRQSSSDLIGQYYVEHKDETSVSLAYEARRSSPKFKSELKYIPALPNPFCRYKELYFDIYIKLSP